MEQKTIAQKKDELIDEIEIEMRARRHNSSDLWDRLWESEGDDTWRKQAMERVYNRVVQLVSIVEPAGSHGVSVVDVGGGRGILAKQIYDLCPSVRQHENNMVVVDHSEKAMEAVREKGLIPCRIDLENDNLNVGGDIYVSTECMEHLSEDARGYLFSRFASARSALISVPNNRLGPDEEPQHTIKYNAMSLKRDLLPHFDHVRIEVLGPYLLAVCGELAKKGHTMSATLPVRDEAEDLEGTLASIRGIADQLVVGVDPRTKDDTFAIAELYADEVFYLVRPMGPPDGHTIKDCDACARERQEAGELAFDKGDDCAQYMGEGGVNFAWARNQCVERCTGEWIFMTEGHERLIEGQQVLLELDQIIPKEARVGFVMRQGQGQQWAFPWLFRNATDITFTRPVHNILTYPEGTYCVMLPNIRTLHDRCHDRGEARAKQRKAQNRSALLDDWLSRKSEASLFYLGQEWRDIDPSKAIDRLEEFLVVSNQGVMRYQARLILAKEYMKLGKTKEASRILHGCTGDDWNRSEHFVWLGDIAFMDEEFEKSHKFYTYAATAIGTPPFTVWWIDLVYYGHLPAQRLAQACGELGRVEEALMWCQKVVDLLPHDAPSEAFSEAAANVTLLEDALERHAEAP